MWTRTEPKRIIKDTQTMVSYCFRSRENTTPQLEGQLGEAQEELLPSSHPDLK